MQFRFTNTDDLQSTVNISISDIIILEKVLAAINRQNMDWLKKQNLYDYPFTLQCLEDELRECKDSTYDSAINHMMQKRDDPRDV